MKVTILGNNSALPAYDRHPTSQIVSFQGVDIMLDCGESTQIQMTRFGMRWRNMDHIFISHLHGDHYFGLFGYITTMSLQGRVNPLHIHAPAPLESLINALLAVASSVLCYKIQFHPLPENGAGLLVDEKQFSVSCFPVEHRIPCYGFLVTEKTKGRKLLPEKCVEYGVPTYFYDRIKQGEDYETKTGDIIKHEWLTIEGPPPSRYAFCADTIYTESFLEYINGVDVMYHESTYLESDLDKATARFHSTAAQAATIAKKAGVKQLLLGHYSSRYKELDGFHNEASAIFPNVQVTVEGITYEV